MQAPILARSLGQLATSFGGSPVQSVSDVLRIGQIPVPNASADPTEGVGTRYTYDALGHLTGVSMPRSNGTQTRTFAYTSTDLTSATNPENGTVTYH